METMKERLKHPPVDDRATVRGTGERNACCGVSGCEHREISGSTGTVRVWRRISAESGAIFTGHRSSRRTQVSGDASTRIKLY